jgi:hypothetical protein
MSISFTMYLKSHLYTLYVICVCNRPKLRMLPVLNVVICQPSGLVNLRVSDLVTDPEISFLFEINPPQELLPTTFRKHVRSPNGVLPD